MSNFNCSFGPDWSLNAVEDLEKRSSPLSEESCSSAAVIQDISYKQPTQSVKCKESRKYEKDDFHINLDKLDIPKMDEYLDGVSPFSDQAEVDHKRTADLKNFDRGYWAEKTIEQQRITQPSCHLSLKDNLASWTSSPHLKGGIGPDNPPLDCTVMCEDKPFDSIPDMNSYQTIGSVERTHTSKVPPIIHRPGDASFENDMSKDRLFTKIHLQKCLLDIFDDTSEFSNTFCTAETQNGIDINTFAAQNKVGKNKENFETFKNPKTDIFLAMKSVSSVSHRTAVGEHSSASGKDSFRQGFSPAIHLQKSRPDSFPEEDHDICEFSNGNFQGDLELSSHLARENGDKIETFEIPHTKMLVTEESQPSESCRNEMSETEAGSDGSEVKICPEELKEASVVTEQIPADVSCLQETLAEMVQVHAHVKCIIKEKLENSNVDFKTPSNSTNKFCNIGDPPFVGEVGIEKKVIASIGSNNCDVQYQFMLERRVLQQLCVQKVLLDTPIKEKLHKDGHFRMFESRYGILPRSV